MAKIWEAEWWTGRSKKQSDLYLKEENVKIVKEDLEYIKNKVIQEERLNCQEALRALNQVKGMEYVANIQEDSFNEIYDNIESAVEAIIQQVDAKVADIKAYDSASWLKKAGSTVAMTGAKFGEGILSVFESIGDGVVSVAGYIGGALGNKSFQDGCANFIKKSWSHDVFNFYYNSDFAKASLYTEDSGIASIVKVAGQTASYLALGGFASGVGASWATSGKGLLKAAGTFAKSTTRINTAIATVGGIGQGTETGLNNGLEYNEAFGKGVKQGLVQGATAYAFGKLGEKAQKNAAVKEAQGQVKQAEQELSKAQEAYKAADKNYQTVANDLAKPNSNVLPPSKADAKAMLDQALDTKVSALKDGITARESLEKATQNLTKVSEAKLSSFQGYTDSITQAGQKAGQQAAKDGLVATVKSVPKNISTSVKNLGAKVDNPQSQLLGANSTPLDKVKSSAQTLYNNSPSIVRKVENAAGNMIAAPAKTTAEIAKGMTAAVAQQSSVAGKALVAGVEAFGIGTGVANNYANAQARMATDTGMNVSANIQDLNASVPSNVSTVYDDKIDLGSNIKTPNNQVTNGNNGNGGTNTGGNGWSNNVNGGDEDIVLPEPTTPEEPVIPEEPTTPENPTTPEEPTTPEVPDKTITNPEPTPTPPTNSDNSGSSGIDHGGNTGGGYNPGGSYNGGNANVWDQVPDSNVDVVEPELPDGELPIEEPTDTIDTEPPTDESESVYTIPTGLTGATTSTKSGKKNSSALPILGGLGAAAAVGVGAKIYMDNKKNNDNGEDDEATDEEFNFTDEDNLLADEWKEDDNTSLNFNDIVNEASEDNDDLGEI